MKYKAIIVDDEVKLQEVLRIKLERFCPQIEVVACASNAWDAYDLIQKYSPQLLFLDIAMPKESGFDLLQRFPKISFEIIFVTGFNQYALDALKISAIDYLLKPVSTEELKSAVQKAIQNIENRQKIERYEVLKHNLESQDKQGTKISIPSGREHHFIQVSDIVRCEGWQKYTKIYLQSGACIISSYNIGVFYDLLEEYEFYNIHKSHLINIHYISKYAKDGTLILKNGSEVPVARRKKEAFLRDVLHKKP